MKRSDFKKRTGGFAIRRGSWQRVLTGLRTPDKGNILMQGQFLLRVPKRVDTVEVRFVRVYPGGKRDGTGDVDVFVGHRRGKDFQWTWQHGIATGDFTVDVEVRVPGKGKATMRYVYGKVFH